MLLDLKSVYEPAAAPVSAAVSGGPGGDPMGRGYLDRLPFENSLLTLWSLGQISDEELEKFLKGL